MRYSNSECEFVAFFHFSTTARKIIRFTAIRRTASLVDHYDVTIYQITNSILGIQLPSVDGFSAVLIEKKNEPKNNLSINIW